MRRHAWHQNSDVLHVVAAHLVDEDPVWSVWPLTFDAVRRLQARRERNLHRMSLVCRAWVQPARRALYRRLCIKGIASLDRLVQDKMALEQTQAICVPLPWLKRADHRLQERGSGFEEAEAEIERYDDESYAEWKYELRARDMDVPVEELADLLTACPTLRLLTFDWVPFPSLPRPILGAMGSMKLLTRLTLASTPEADAVVRAEGLLDLVFELPELRRLAFSGMALTSKHEAIDAVTSRITHLSLHYVCIADEALHLLCTACASFLIALESEGLDEADAELPFAMSHEGVLLALSQLGSTLQRFRWFGTTAPPSFLSLLLSSFLSLRDLELCEYDCLTPAFFAALSDMRNLRYLYLDQRNDDTNGADLLSAIRGGLATHPIKRLRALELADDRYPIEMTDAREQLRAEEELEGIEALFEERGTTRCEFVRRRDGAAFGYQFEEV